MSVTLLLKCLAPGDQLHLGKKICGVDEDVEPVFTTRLSEASKDNPQPTWLCKAHRRGVRKVSAMTGQRV